MIEIPEREFRPFGDAGYLLELPKAATVLSLDRLRRERGELVAELTVGSNVPGVPAVDGIVHVADFNLSSARARQERARILTERSRMELDWLGLLEELCQRTLAAERAGKPAIHIRDLERPGPDDSLDVDGIRLERRHPTFLFGDGGTCKTYVAAHVAVRLSGLGFRIGWFDWEFDGPALAQRFDLLAGDDLPNVFYARCERPLVHEADRLRQIVRDERLDYVILDSVAFACDGPAGADEVASAYFRALRRLRVGSLNIAHNTKAGDEDKPFGSVFWHNGARCSWYVKRSDQAGDPEHVSIGLFNRKWNLGPRLPAVGFDIAFGSTTTTFDTAEVGNTPDLADRLPVWQRIAALVGREGALTLVSIAGQLDEKVDTVTKAVRRAEGKVFVRVPGTDGIYRVGLLDRRAA